MDKVGGNVESGVEDGEQTVSLALEDLETGVRNELDAFLEERELREGIAVAAEKQRRTRDPLPVLRPQVFRMTGAVQRLRKKY